MKTGNLNIKMERKEDKELKKRERRDEKKGKF